MRVDKTIYYSLPLRLRLQIKARIRLGYLLNLRQPRTFNERINAFKLGEWTEQHVRCADKIAVREYVAESGFRSILGTAHVFSDDFSFEELNCSLASYGDLFLKANHNSGPVIRVRYDDSRQTKEIAHEIIRRQLKQSHGYVNGELWYDRIAPRALCERTYIDCDGNLPADYKFHVFTLDGNARVFLQYDYDRFDDHARTLFTEDLEMLPFSLQYKNRWKSLAPPPRYGEMLTIAKALARPFRYARVDLYNVDGSIYFGEMTFAPDGGFARFSEKCFDYEWGRLLG